MKLTKHIKADVLAGKINLISEIQITRYAFILGRHGLNNARSPA
jgi:hypothetical protein